MVVLAGGSWALFLSQLFVGIVLLVFVVLVVIVFLLLSLLAVVVYWRFLTIHRVVTVLRRIGVLGRKFAILPALVLPLFHPLPLSSPLLFQLPLLALLDFVLSHQSRRGVPKDRLVFAKVADPNLFGLRRMTPVVELGFTAARLCCRRVLFRGASTGALLGGRLLVLPASPTSR